MSQTVVIDLPDETKAALDAAIREEGVSESELIERALKDYLFIRRFRSLREHLMASAPETYTDQDVFDRVS
jgi:metal-responsive CopG/Arc/MetJ family transcriptional regulator